MNLPRNGLASFVKFMSEQYGVAWLDNVQKGEVKRCMLKDRIVLIREHDMRRTEESVEVFCSDKAVANEIEANYLIWVAEQEALEAGDVESLDK